MNKIISIALNVLSFISALSLMFVGSLCIYDLITFSSSAFAGSIDLWMAMRIYVTLLFAFSIPGMLICAINFIFYEKTRSNVLNILLFVLFAIGFIGAIVLFYFSHNF